MAAMLRCMLFSSENHLWRSTFTCGSIVFACRRVSMEQLEQEFADFFVECKQQGFTSKEMRAICPPLLHRRNNRCYVLLGVLLAMMAAFYLLYNWSEEFSWFVSAIGRLVLLQLLPYWNWTPLYSSRCLIERAVDKNGAQSATSTMKALGRYETEAENCVLCEMLERIPATSNTTFSFLESVYLERGLPVIVTDSHRPRSLNMFLDEMYSAPLDFLESNPCDVSTNLMLIKLFNLELALQKIKSTTPSAKWFLHLRNCERRAVKASRRFVTRPYYYPLHLEPFYSSWVLMSQNYASEQLREIYLQGLVFVQQLYGYFDIRLRPKQPCQGPCPVVNIRLSAGECLIFSTDLWIFNYGTEELESKTASIATVLEIDWQL
ncbi:uncharacterized protein LOC118742458 [Rhagoletis pomonella]|uniref:uncharacterized protein LOC118742458 n=1 Tax=Rhagoletis pomonella TaxID=28610 RepID=UPI0017864D13|nr:uncharacterized protein LOC118742458 [Rhagoletis pomonella]